MNQIQAQFGYTLDGEGKVGTIVTDAPALATLKAVIYGKSHDRGMMQKKGFLPSVLPRKRYITCPSDILMEILRRKSSLYGRPIT